MSTAEEKIIEVCLSLEGPLYYELLGSAANDDEQKRR
jgi:hypothetical protein